MRITQVEYRELVTTGNYSNITIGATAAVEAGDAPTGVLLQLKEWVRVQLAAKAAEREQVVDAETRLWEVQRQLADTERDLKVAADKWEAAKAFLDKHGIRLDEPLPF